MYTAIVLALAFVAAVVLYALLTAVWRLLKEEGRLRLHRMLRRHRAQADLGTRAGTLATRRCIACPSQAECDAYLRGGDSGAPAAFCPNAEFIALAARRAAD